MAVDEHPAAVGPAAGCGDQHHAIVRLLRDTTALNWRAVAKDGMPLPAQRALVGQAVQQLGNGETYDFEFIPKEPGAYRLIVTSGVGVLLATQPIRAH